MLLVALLFHLPRVEQLFPEHHCTINIITGYWQIICQNLMSDKARITSAFNLTKNIVRNNFHGDFLPDYPVNISYFDI